MLYFGKRHRYTNLHVNIFLTIEQWQAIMLFMEENTSNIRCETTDVCFFPDSANISFVKKLTTVLEITSGDIIFFNNFSIFLQQSGKKRDNK